MKTSTLRNFRVPDDAWIPAKRAADVLGISMTLVITTSLRAFARTPQIVIGEPEVVEMPKRFYDKAEKLFKAYKRASKKK